MEILGAIQTPLRVAGQAYKKLPQPLRTAARVGGRFAFPLIDAVDLITAKDKGEASLNLGQSSLLTAGPAGPVAALTIEDLRRPQGFTYDKDYDTIKGNNPERYAAMQKLEREELKRKQKERGDELISMVKETLIPLYQKRSRSTPTEDAQLLEESRSTPNEDVQPLENTLEEIPVQQQPAGESQAEKAMEIAKNELALKYEREREQGMQNINEIKTALGYEEGSDLAQWADANPALAQRLYAKTR